MDTKQQAEMRGFKEPLISVLRKIALFPRAVIKTQSNHGDYKMKINSLQCLMKSVLVITSFLLNIEHSIATEQLLDIMERRAEISRDTGQFLTSKLLEAFVDPTALTFIAKRSLQAMEGFNILEIQNNNSRPLSISYFDQENSFQKREIGIVPAGAVKKFQLNRDTLPRSYAVIGELGYLRNSTYEYLSFKKFYIKLVFESSTIGTTTVHLDTEGDVYP